MTNSKVFEAGYKMSTAQALLEAMGATSSLRDALIKENYTNDQLFKMVEYGNENTVSEDLEKNTVERAVSDYMDGLKELKTMYDMAKGYEEMGELNLSISNDFQALEEEGEQLSELDKKETEGNTE